MTDLLCQTTINIIIMPERASASYLPALPPSLSSSSLPPPPPSSLQWGAARQKRGRSPKPPKVSKIFFTPVETTDDALFPTPIQDERRRGKVRRRGQAGGLRADHNPGPRSGELACRCRYGRSVDASRGWDVWNASQMHPNASKCIL